MQLKISSAFKHNNIQPRTQKFLLIDWQHMVYSL